MGRAPRRPLGSATAGTSWQRPLLALSLLALLTCANCDSMRQLQRSGSQPKSGSPPTPTAIRRSSQRAQYQTQKEALRQRLEQAKLRKQLEEQRLQGQQQLVEPASATGAPPPSTSPAAEPPADGITPVSLQDVSLSGGAQRGMAAPTDGTQLSPLELLQAAMIGGGGGSLAGRYETGARRLAGLPGPRRLGPR
ncbi:hypothetical protein Rsub_05748 [Raphidocelis subcapitata]|uniref:Uncharacterized protein n=1 Tax=Raphidocelis subcapitata TaxID=307507 RepID=A0A2V0P204_9CHLO|nr:hypothetical protein Rsub_05748 [Raphidocelis subcapitata]|eukprot:GBF92912.1 hypothetical protein Rsub_05748 [Raphidocelis subcapitata]